MDFSVEFYETAAGTCPVQEFLDELKAIPERALRTARERMRDWQERMKL